MSVLNHTRRGFGCARRSVGKSKRKRSFIVKGLNRIGGPIETRIYPTVAADRPNPSPLGRSAAAVG